MAFFEGVGHAGVGGEGDAVEGFGQPAVGEHSSVPPEREAEFFVCVGDAAGASCEVVQEVSADVVWLSDAGARDVGAIDEVRPAHAENGFFFGIKIRDDGRSDFTGRVDEGRSEREVFAPQNVAFSSSQILECEGELE